MCNYCATYSALVSGDNSPATLQSEAAQLLRPSLEMMLADSQATAAAETAQSNAIALNQTLSQVVEELQTLLPQFASSEAESLENMRLAFGDSFSATDANALLAAWQAGDFEALPTIAFLSATALGSANGAYEAQTGTIYLSAEAFELYQNDIPTLVAIVAEEFGHHIDSVLNGAEDTQGDEGAIFAALVQGKALSVEQLQRLQQEEDQVTIAVDDASGDEGTRTIAVEQNQASQISFEDVTASAGNFISGRSYGAGAWGDFNGDGLPDLWVNNHFGSGRNLFVNNGDGTFTDIVNQVEAGTSDVFLESEIRGDFHGVAWADFDNDGDQDLLQLVGGEGNTSVLGQENLPPRSEPNRLYVNENGVLRDQAPALGLSYDSSKSQTPAWLDYDKDGRLDLFHGSTQRADGLTPTTVFRQQANGQFDDVGDSVLPEELVDRTVRFGGLGYLSDQDLYDLVLPGAVAELFDVTTTPFTNIVDETIGGSRQLKGARDFAFADFNNDGLMDAYMARVQDDRLFFNTPDDGLVRVSDSAGIEAVDTSNAVGVVAADFDNDMDVDIYVVRESVNGVNLPNVMFDNQGDGTFVAVANQGGAVSATEGVGDNATVADYDVDGFIDIFVTNGAKTALSGPQQLFRNRGNSHNWLQIDLVGAVSLTDSEGNVRAGTNRDGIGAQVYVTAGGVRQRRDQNGGVHKHSQDFQRLHFGLAQNEQVERIEVRWPSGVVQQIDNVGANQVLTITEQATPVTPPVTPPPDGTPVTPPVTPPPVTPPPDGTPVTPPGDGGGNPESPFTSVSGGRSLELTELGNDSVTFGFNNVNVERTGLITVFNVSGGTRAQIGSFSLLQDGEPSGFSPRFTLSRDDVNEGDILQFEIVEDGNTRGAIATSTNTGASLDFGDGTVLSVSPVEEDPVDYVSGDGEALDFSGTGGAGIRFTVYREAQFDSTVGLYQVDDLNGDITVGNQTFSVGEAGYAQAALNRAVSGVNLRTGDGGSDVFTVNNLDGFYGTFITVDDGSEANTYFSYESVNAGSADHVKYIGNNALGFEDLPGLGDADFDDIVVTFDTV